MTVIIKQCVEILEMHDRNKNNTKITLHHNISTFDNLLCETILVHGTAFNLFFLSNAGGSDSSSEFEAGGTIAERFRLFCGVGVVQTSACSIDRLLLWGVSVFVTSRPKSAAPSSFLFLPRRARPSAISVVLSAGGFSDSMALTLFLLFCFL